MQQGSTSQVQDISVTHQYPLAIVPATEVITPIASHYEMTNKRTFYDAMEIEKEDNWATSKKQKIEVEGELVKVTKKKGK